MNKIKNSFNRMLSRINTASIERENSENALVKGAYGIGAGAMAVAAASAPVLAKNTSDVDTGNGALDNIFGKLKLGLESVYKGFFAISTVAVFTVSAGCLVAKMISKNPKTIETASTWMKRAWIAYGALNCLVLIVKYIGELVGKDENSTESPWDGLDK